MNLITELAKTKKSCNQLKLLTATEKNKLLSTIATKLLANKQQILIANQQDLTNAKATNLKANLLARLTLNEQQLIDIIKSIEDTIQLPDPVGKILSNKTLANGLKLEQITVPLGVIAVIYESRPNVTVDVATLCLKSGNAVILRGGKEALNTNKAMLVAIHQALAELHLPVELVTLITDPDRQVIHQLLRHNDFIDLLIPRGGEALQQLCVDEAKMPVITGGIGVCHIYVDKDVSTELAINVIDNAKTQKPSVCNALETLLINREIANDFLPLLAKQLTQKNVYFHADETSFKILNAVTNNVEPLQNETLAREWLTLDLNVCVVDNWQQAVTHIQQYGSGHSEVILSNNTEIAKNFVAAVDAAAVYINASSRFTDGGQFGLGCEIAISTQKTHARGPLGLEALVTYKWIGSGDYLVRK